MNKVVLTLAALLVSVSFGILGWWAGKTSTSEKTSSPISIVKPRPLDKYTIENLAKADIPAGKIEVGDILDKQPAYTSFLFSLYFSPTIDSSETKKVTGLLNLPNAAGPFPLIVMLRGYVDQERYITGDGTKKAAEVFAENGFITVAPDFLGYAGSDGEAGNIFEARFQTYVTVLSLIKSLNQIDTWDGKNIFIWSHSNGGQIALTLLEITGRDFPTTLWAPVSKPFPYSVLYYTDESEDKGKLIRRELAKFEEQYEVELYSLSNYLDKINAPLQIHQGMADDAVPVAWSEELVKQLSSLNLRIDYLKYPDTDHNMKPSWDTAVSHDLRFFRSNLKK